MVFMCKTRKNTVAYADVLCGRLPRVEQP